MWIFCCCFKFFFAAFFRSRFSCWLLKLHMPWHLVAEKFINAIVQQKKNAIFQNETKTKPYFFFLLWMRARQGDGDLEYNCSGHANRCNSDLYLSFSLFIPVKYWYTIRKLNRQSLVERVFIAKSCRYSFKKSGNIGQAHRKRDMNLIMLRFSNLIGVYLTLISIATANRTHGLCIHKKIRASCEQRMQLGKSTKRSRS